MNLLKEHLKIEKGERACSVPYYLQLERKLRTLIESGEISSGNQLPSESEISEICQVSRVTVRQALKNLEKNRLVYRIPGKGTFAGEYSASNSAERDTGRTIIVFMAGTCFHPYAMQLLEGIERQASLFDFSVMITSDQHKILTDKPAAGIIFTERAPVSLLKKLQERDIPFVITQEHHETYGEIFPSVCLDNCEAAYKQTKYLIGSGHRRIAIFTGILYDYLKGEGNRKRIVGYKQALEENNIAFDNLLVKECNYDSEKTMVMTREIMELKNPPTAIIAADDVGAGITINTLRASGLKIPDDVSVIGMGGLELVAAISPALTTFHIPVTEIGERAFSLLYQVMKNEKNNYPIYVHGSLITRDSCSVIK